jgi:uncharacterized delta-60 repeat protein
MSRVLPALTALIVASAGHGQHAWVVDTTFHTDIEWRTISDIEFMPDGLLLSGEMKFENDLGLYGTALLGAAGLRVGDFQQGAGGGSIGLWADRYYIGIGAGVKRKYYDGTADWSYSSESIFISSVHAGKFHTYPDGKVLMTGGHDLWSLEDTTFLGPNFCLVRLDTTGALDTTFQHRRCQSGITKVIHPLEDGKFILSGSQNVYDDQFVGHVLRVNPDGSVDSTFHTTIDYGYATDFFSYPDGRILCSGWFHTPELPGDTVQLLRLLPDGSLDHSFNYDLHFLRFPSVTTPPAVVQGMHALDSATLLIGGSFTTLNGEWVGGIVVIDTAGNVLQDYFPGMGCDSLISPPNILSLGLRDFKVAPDGSLYAYGFFDGFDDGYTYDSNQRLIVKLKSVELGMPHTAPVSAAFHLYPNPGEDYVLLALAEPVSNMMVSIRDSQGRLKLSTTLLPNPVRCDTRNWPSGVFFIEATTPQGVRFMRKWIKP